MEGGDTGLEEREGGRRGRMEVMCRLWTRSEDGWILIYVPCHRGRGRGGGGGKTKKNKSRHIREQANFGAHVFSKKNFIINTIWAPVRKRIFQERPKNTDRSTVSQFWRTRFFKEKLHHQYNLGACPQANFSGATKNTDRSN